MQLTEKEAQPRAAVGAHLALGIALGTLLRQQPFPLPESSRAEVTEEARAALAWAVDHDRNCYPALYGLACFQVLPLQLL